MACRRASEMAGGSPPPGGAEDISAIPVVYAGVYVQAAAGDVGKGLGHEGGRQPVLACHPLDDASEQHGLVAGDHRVVQVVGVDFPLPRGELRVHGSHRYGLKVAGLAHVIQESVAIDQVVRHAILDTLLPHVGTPLFCPAVGGGRLYRRWPASRTPAPWPPPFSGPGHGRAAGWRPGHSWGSAQDGSRVMSVKPVRTCAVGDSSHGIGARVPLMGSRS